MESERTPIVVDRTPPSAESLGRFLPIERGVVGCEKRGGKWATSQILRHANFDITQSKKYRKNR